MTNYLIAQAREMQKRMIATTLPGELANALEAQARRIAHLEEMYNGWRDEAIKASARIDEFERMLAVHRLAVDVDALKARIAELTAALKPFADYAEQMADDVDKWSVATSDLRAARAAYLGEKE